MQTAHDSTLAPLVAALPPLFTGEPPRRDDRAETLYALERAARYGWTRNAATHAALSALASAGLVTHEGSEIRLGARLTPDAKPPRVWAGSLWELTEAGLVRLGELRGAIDVTPQDPAAEIPTWTPCEVARSERIRSGEYRVTLTNGHRATVQRDAGVWAWSYGCGGVEGLATKAQAIESLRKARG